MFLGIFGICIHEIVESGGEVVVDFPVRYVSGCRECQKINEMDTFDIQINAPFVIFIGILDAGKGHDENERQGGDNWIYRPKLREKLDDTDCQEKPICSPSRKTIINSAG